MCVCVCVCVCVCEREREREGGVGGLEVGLLVGSPGVLSYHWLSGEK